MAWILADKQGNRFMNEYQPYTQDTGHRALDVYDTGRMEFPYVPYYMTILKMVLVISFRSHYI